MVLSSWRREHLSRSEYLRVRHELGLLAWQVGGDRTKKVE
jgi:hypothetical protein